MINMGMEFKTLNHIARQANWLEINGNIPGSDRLRMLLESHNCCLFCGTSQVNIKVGGEENENWICPTCDI